MKMLNREERKEYESRKFIIGLIIVLSVTAIIKFPSIIIAAPLGYFSVWLAMFLGYGKEQGKRKFKEWSFEQKDGIHKFLEETQQLRDKENLK